MNRWRSPMPIGKGEVQRSVLRAFPRQLAPFLLRSSLVIRLVTLKLLHLEATICSSSTFCFSPPHSVEQLDRSMEAIGGPFTSLHPPT